MIRILLFAFFAVYVYTLISIISVLLLENRNPARSLSWVLVLTFVPILGMLFYVVFGQDLRKKNIINKKSILRLTNRPVASFDIEKMKPILSNGSHLNLLKMLYNNSGAAGYSYNKIEVLPTGESTFDAVFNAIRNAKKHIHIEFFIFDDDKISNQLREILIQKAAEGVRVRMIYDYWGSFDLSKKYLKSLRDAGVYVRSFLPFRFRFQFSNSRINYRNHRKLVIVDGEIGFTGGLNVADRYIFGNTLGKWRDTFVCFQGAAVHGLQQLFLVDWYFVDRKLITDEKYFPLPKIYDNNIVQIVSSGPDSDWEAIMQGISSAIMSAQKYIYIQSPYFMPNEVIASSIHMAALSGVEVRLMIPFRSDSRLSDASTFSFLGEALEAGVRVFRYKSGFLHSKAIVIDDVLSIVGSCNLDERSFSLNFEANAFIYENKTAIQLRQLFLLDVANCEEVILETWTNRRRRQKLKESMARLFSPLM